MGYFMLAKDYRKFRAQVLAFIHDYRTDPALAAHRDEEIAFLQNHLARLRAKFYRLPTA